MMDLWWKFGGTVRLRLTGADPEGTLRHLAREVRLEQIDRISALVVEFSIPRWELEKAKRAAGRHGDQLEIQKREGLPELLLSWLHAPIITATVLILIAATAFVPSRILFIRVEGNETVPTRLILERAEQCGLYFGSSRGELRSEQIKNRLLEAVPELSWVGVNTSGCVATISVKERQIEPEEAPVTPGNVVAVTDAVVTELTVTAGTPLCAVGDGVKAGQVLISGYTDLGLCTHIQAADGEVYGLTRRRTEAVIPKKTLIPGAETAVVKKYSLLIGKNRINFDSDSGILYTGCGKMTQIRYLRLPGGWELPIALVVEVYTVTELTCAERWEQTAGEILEEASRAQILREMTAGQILGAETEVSADEGVYWLSGLYECREMIGRRSSGILTEGDTNDGEIGERGAG